MSQEGPPPRSKRYRPIGRQQHGNSSGGGSFHQRRHDALFNFLSSAPRPAPALNLPQAVHKMCPILKCAEIDNLKVPLAPVSIVVGPCGSGKTIGIPALLAGRLSTFKGLLLQRTRLAVKKSFEQQSKLEKDFESYYPILPGRIQDKADQSYLGRDFGVDWLRPDTNFFHTTYAAAGHYFRENMNVNASVIFLDDFEGAGSYELLILERCLVRGIPAVILVDYYIKTLADSICEVMARSGKNEDLLAVFNCEGERDKFQSLHKRTFIMSAGDYEECTEEEIVDVRASRRGDQSDDLYADETEHFQHALEAVYEIFQGRIPRGYGTQRKGVLFMAPSLQMLLDIRSRLVDRGGIGARVILVHSKMGCDQLKDFNGEESFLLLASEVADDGITIPGVTHVVDLGMTRESYKCDPIGRTVFWSVYADKRKASRRAGRTGRTCDGYVVYPFNKDTASRIISSTDVRQACYDLDEEKFVAAFESYVKIADEAVLDKALKSCVSMNILQNDQEIIRRTPFGEWYVQCKLSLTPRLAKLVLAGAVCGVLTEVAKIVAIMAGGANVYGMFRLAHREMELGIKTPRAQELMRIHEASDSLSAHIFLLRLFNCVTDGRGHETFMREHTLNNAIKQYELICDRMGHMGFDVRECRGDKKTVNSRVIIAIAMGLGDRVGEQECSKSARALNTSWAVRPSPRDVVTFQHSSFYHYGPAIEAINGYNNMLAVYHSIDMSPDNPEAIASIMPPDIFVAVGNVGQNPNESGIVRTTTLGALSTDVAGRQEQGMLRIREGAEAAFDEACINARFDTNYEEKPAGEQRWLSDAIHIYEDFATIMETEVRQRLNN